ncbi:MAG TPA: succinylglutamate desuccinylase/aspartoacylase family protein [Pyrinomonadaceae bacterium]|nr:succinylglutamate desuccinylase/aspartoacylase family protein [Pyrinomonadaceae bacterium]
MAAIVETRVGLALAGNHLIASIRGPQAGPTLIILGGIHGNEPAGVLAAGRVITRLQERKSCLRGEVILLAGNTRALERNARYIDADLNRLWTTENVLKTRSDSSVLAETSESCEQRELLVDVEAAIERARGEAFFIDLHTTSAHGKPFATVGDTIRNRHFAFNFPVTIVLGLEEQLDGTLLEYVNNLGLITMGLEAGQHVEASSVDNHEATIWLACEATGNLRRQDIPEFESYFRTFAHAASGKRVVEVRHRHAIRPAENFRMEPGFGNFQPVRRGQLLAHDRNGEISAKETGLILLPLYQKLGDDGFFLGRRVKRFWLRLSALLRHLKIGNFVHFLPGVDRDPLNENLLIVNTRVARILPLQIFHLLGFRKRRWDGSRLIVSRRAHDLEGPASKHVHS